MHNSPSALQSVKEWLFWGKQFLLKGKIRSAEKIALWFMEKVMGMEGAELYTHFSCSLSSSQAREYRELIERKRRGEPWQYIQEEVPFLSCRIHVNGDLLIPRMETEALVARMLTHSPSLEKEGLVVWDLCCGSGCIAIAIKRAFPNLRVYASDFSSRALAMARKNMVYNGVEIALRWGDFLVPLREEKIAVDFLICNPPYISEEEYPHLEREVRLYEPKLALVAGNNGLYFYRLLAQELFPLLSPEAQVHLEMGDKQADKLLSLFSSSRWKEQKIGRDEAGRERYFSFVKNSKQK